MRKEYVAPTYEQMVFCLRVWQDYAYWGRRNDGNGHQYSEYAYEHKLTQPSLFESLRSILVPKNIAIGVRMLHKLVKYADVDSVNKLSLMARVIEYSQKYPKLFTPDEVAVAVAILKTFNDEYNS